MVALSTVSTMQSAAAAYDSVTNALSMVTGLTQTETVSVAVTGAGISNLTVSMNLSSYVAALQAEQTRLVGLLTSLGVTSLS